MKKHLFTKFLALLLTGAMLTGAGCKNYDDDIDGINQRLDELVTGKITPMEEQITAMKSAVTNLQNADKLMGDRIAELESDVTANASEIAKLQTAQSTLRTDIDKIKANYVTSDQLTTTLASYTTTADLAKTYAKLSDLGVYATDAELKTAIEKAIKEALVQAKTDATTAAGEVFKTSFQGAFDGALTAALAKGGEIDIELEAYDKAIRAAITTAITENNSVVNEKIAEEIQAAVEKLQTQIDSLKKQVDALASQIQSLVYVPEFEDGQTDMVVYTIGAAELGNKVNIKFRVSPASAAANMKALFEAGKLALVADQVKSRAAAAPEAAITDISTEGMAEGMFVVSATVANYPAADKVAVALTVKSNIYKEGDKEVVNNDVVSNYGVIAKAAAQPLEFALCDAEGKALAGNMAYTKPWNASVAESKVTLLEGYDLKASLDGGKTYKSLKEAVDQIGAGAITNMAYTATATATPVDAKLALVNKDLVWSSKLATIAFAKALTSADKGVTATVKHKITCKINNVPFTVLNDFETSYTVSNQVGASMTFADQNLPWTYEFVKSGVGAVNPAPDFTSNEIEISGDLKGITLGEIMATIPVIEITPADANVTVELENVASQVNKIAKIKLSKYAWGKTYDVKAIYTLNNTDYTLSGKIITGAAPEKIVYNYAVEEKAYADFAKTGNWGDLYATIPNTFFKDKAQFTEALFAGNKAATVETKRFDTKASATGSVIAATNGTVMTATQAVLKGEIKKADVAAIGNRFVQKAAWTTWYGQQIEVSMSFDITLPAHNLVANPDRLTAGVGTAHGIVENNVWKIIDVDLSDFYSISPANGALSIVYAVKSKDAGSKVFPTLSGKKLIWTAGTTTESMVEMTAQLMLDGTITVGAPVPFTMKADDPIKTFAAPAATQSAKYVYDAKIEFNLLKGVSLIDAANKAWIKADGSLELSGTNNSKVIFAMTSGTIATGGIKYGTPVVANGTFAGLSITDNTLTIPKNQAGLEQDVTITIPAEITYWLGGTKKINIQVKITK